MLIIFKVNKLTVFFIYPPWLKEKYSHKSTYTYRVQSSVWRLRNYWPPTPFPPSECVLPPLQRWGDTHLPGGEGGGRGVKISEDARRWIGLLQYNPSTDPPWLKISICTCDVRQARFTEKPAARRMLMATCKTTKILVFFGLVWFDK